MREWLLDGLEEEWSVARGDVERVLKLAEHIDGVRAAARHDIDVLGVVPASHPALPHAFLSKRLRQCVAFVRDADNRRCRWGRSTAPD